MDNVKCFISFTLEEEASTIEKLTKLGVHPSNIRIRVASEIRYQIIVCLSEAQYIALRDDGVKICKDSVFRLI